MCEREAQTIDKATSVRVFVLAIMVYIYILNITTNIKYTLHIHEHWTHKVRQALFTVKKTGNVIAVPQNAKVKWRFEEGIVKKEDEIGEKSESSSQKYNSANLIVINDDQDMVANGQMKFILLQHQFIVPNALT